VEAFQNKMPVTRSTLARAAPPLWDEDEDYDSDICVGLRWSLHDRTRSKLTSLIHAGMVDLDDADGNWPSEAGYDIATATPSLDDLQSFVVECEEVLVWCRQSRRAVETDVQTICYLHRELRKEDRLIGPRAVLELSMLVLTWITYYRSVYENGLLTEQPARASRASTRASLRAGRHARTVTTTTEALVQRLEALKASIDAALALVRSV
jgi:hypothetical protein